VYNRQFLPGDVEKGQTVDDVSPHFPPESESRWTSLATPIHYSLAYLASTN